MRNSTRASASCRLQSQTTTPTTAPRHYQSELEGYLKMFRGLYTNRPKSGGHLFLARAICSACVAEGAMICLRVTASLERHDRFFINTLDPTPTCCRPHLPPFPFPLISLHLFSFPDPAHLLQRTFFLHSRSGAPPSERRGGGDERRAVRR